MMQKEGLLTSGTRVFRHRGQDHFRSLAFTVIDLEQQRDLGRIRHDPTYIFKKIILLKPTYILKKTALTDLWSTGSQGWKDTLFRSYCNNLGERTVHWTRVAPGMIRKTNKQKTEVYIYFVDRSNGIFLTEKIQVIKENSSGLPSFQLERLQAQFPFIKEGRQASGWTMFWPHWKT